MFWITAMILANYKKNGISFGLFLAAIWTSGELQSIALEYAVDLGYSREIATLILVFCIIVAALSILVGVIIGAYFINQDLSDKLFIIGFIGLILILIIEIIAIMIFDFDFVYIITTPIVIILVLFGTIWEGTKILQKAKNDQWMLSSISLMLDLMILASRLFLWIIRLFRR